LAWGFPVALNIRMSTLGDFLEIGFELDKPDGSVDVLAENGLVGVDITGNHASDRQRPRG
jgi:hypothetical protein